MPTKSNEQLTAEAKPVLVSKLLSLCKRTNEQLALDGRLEQIDLDRVRYQVDDPTIVTWTSPSAIKRASFQVLLNYHDKAVIALIKDVFPLRGKEDNSQLRLCKTIITKKRSS